MSTRTDALLDAIEKNDLAAAKKAVAAGGSVTAVRDRGHGYETTPLLSAAFSAPALVPWLLEVGADPKEKLGDRTALDSLFLPVRGEGDDDGLLRVEERVAALRALARGSANVDEVSRQGVRLLGGAAAHAPLALVEALLDAGAKIDAKGQFGRTALHEVAGHDARTPVLALLLTRGAKVDAKDEKGVTPLGVAVGKLRMGRMSIAHARTLLEAGADPSHVDEDGVSILAVARAEATPEMVALLLAHSAKPAPTRTLLEALVAGDETTAEARIPKAKLDTTNEKGATALHLAAQHAPRLVPALLARGADPKIKDAAEETALHKVAAAGLGLDPADVLAAAEALLDAGLDPNSPSKRGALPLGRVLSRRRDDALPLVELLLSRGAKASACDDTIFSGFTMLGIAANRGRLSFVEALLHAGAKVEGKSKREGLTAILSIWSTSGARDDEAGRLACLKRLLDAGANVDARDTKDRRTVLHEVAKKRDLAPALALLDAGANPNVADSRGETPLHHAAFWRWGAEMVRLLLARGADPTIRDREGKTALDVVSDDRRADEIRALLGAAKGTQATAPQTVFGAYGVAEGDAEALAKAFAKKRGVKLHPDVKRYVTGELEIAGVLRLGTFAERHVFDASFDRLFGRLGETLFPGLHIGSRFGVDVWLMLETGRLVALHHDATFAEVAATVKARSRDKFVEAFVEKGSALTLAQLAAIEKAAVGLDLTEKKDASALVDAIAGVLEKPRAATVKALSNDVRLEILRELVRPAL